MLKYIFTISLTLFVATNTFSQPISEQEFTKNSVEILKSISLNQDFESRYILDKVIEKNSFTTEIDVWNEQINLLIMQAELARARIEAGLITKNGYEQVLTSNREIGTKNKLAFDFYASSKKINRVVLTLEINKKASEKINIDQYASFVSEVIKHVVGMNLHNTTYSKILDRQPFSLKKENMIVNFKELPNSDGTYRLSFEVESLSDGFDYEKLYI